MRRSTLTLLAFFFALACEPASECAEACPTGSECVDGLCAEPADAGRTADAGEGMDAGPPVGLDAGPPPSCADVATARGWQLCSESAERCALVFEDGAGCAEVCASLGRECAEAFDDTPGACDFMPDAPLGCGETGHTSDYCVCGAPAPVDAGASDAGQSEVDAGMRDAGDRPPHEALLDEAIGFGRHTTGGAGGPVVTVTTLADSGAGSLREAAEQVGPAWIRFAVSGVIALSSQIEVESDKTIDGRGADVTITGGGLFVQSGRGNVILNNLRLRDSPDDLIRFHNGGARMWVHHCDLENGGDGAFDATEGVTEVTVSYTHIRNHDKAMLVGAGSDEGDGASMRWTGHHNWYEDVVQRMPFIRFGWAHSFNNLIEWISGTAMSVRLAGSQMLVENNIFAPQTNVGHKLISDSDGRGAARLRGNLERPLAGDVIEFTEHLPDTVFAAADQYPYTLEVADDALIERLRAQAGWQDAPFPE